MRNPARIKRINNKIEKLWKQLPDLRYFQLLSFIKIELLEAPDTMDLFYMEDDILEEALDKYLNETR